MKGSSTGRTSADVRAERADQHTRGRRPVRMVDRERGIVIALFVFPRPCCSDRISAEFVVSIAAMDPGPRGFGNAHRAHTPGIAQPGGGTSSGRCLALLAGPARASDRCARSRTVRSWPISLKKSEPST